MEVFMVLYVIGLSLCLIIVAMALELGGKYGNARLAYVITLVLLAVSVSTVEESETLEKAKQQIEQCEKELPRNQECELKAVPKN
jgi:hypothetical protein